MKELGLIYSVRKGSPGVYGSVSHLMAPTMPSPSPELERPHGGGAKLRFFSLYFPSFF